MSRPSTTPFQLEADLPGAGKRSSIQSFDSRRSSNLSIDTLSIGVPHAGRNNSVPSALMVTEPTPISPRSNSAPFGGRPKLSSLAKVGEASGSEGRQRSLELPSPSSMGSSFGSHFGSDISDGDADDARPRPTRKHHSLRRHLSIENLAVAGLLGTLHSGARPNRIILKVRNETGLPLKTAYWPTKIKRRGDVSYRLCYLRGNYWDEDLTPSPSERIEDELHVLACIRKGTSAGFRHKQRLGWVYFDLIHANGYVLHLQAFVRLTSSGAVDEVLLGRFDLDSSKTHPMPSGKLGRVEVDPDVNSIITIVLPPAMGRDRNVVDDSTRKPMAVIPQKGLIVTSYVSHPHARACLLAGKDGRYHEAQLQPTFGLLGSVRQTKHQLGGLDNASASLWVQHADDIIFTRSLYVNPLTGMVKDADRAVPLASTSETTSIFSPTHDLTVSFGFHDSGLGRRHFMYVYATRDRSSWLGDLITHDNRWLDVPFSRLVLAASHDSGMYGDLHPEFYELILQNKLGADLGKFVFDAGLPIVAFLIKILKSFHIKPEIAICNVANTQKDSFTDQLRIGTRFFDFRPGFCFHNVLNGFKGDLHHQHALIPGVRYIEALRAIFLFLATHEKEIVVVELKSDGFVITKPTWREDKVPVYSMIPTPAELAKAIEEARSTLTAEKAVMEIQVGGAKDLDRKIGDLLSEHRRLLIIDRMGGDVEPDRGWEWDRDDSSDHALYDTDGPEQILTALNTTHASSRAQHEEASMSGNGDGKPLKGCIYQLQATPTKSIGDDVLTSLTYSKASSLLVFTKARVDPHTYEWVKHRKFVEPGLVVLLNDFVDSVLVEHAVEKSRQRAGLVG